jgi:hypothetical protein
MKVILNVVSKDTKCRSMASLRDMRVLGDFAVEDCCLSPGVFIFLTMRLSHEIDLKRC